MFDGAVYPVLAAEYIGGRANVKALGKGVSSCDWVRGGVDFDDDYYGELDCESETGKRVVAQLIIVLVTAIKLAGTDWMVRSQGLLFIGSLVPTAIFVLCKHRPAGQPRWSRLAPLRACHPLHISPSPSRHLPPGTRWPTLFLL